MWHRVQFSSLSSLSLFNSFHRRKQDSHMDALSDAVFARRDTADKCSLFFFCLPLCSLGAFITSLAKEVMFLVALVCLFVCLFVCEQHYSKSYKRIGMKFYGRVLSSTSKNWLNFGGDLGIVRWVNEQKNTVIVVAYPDRGEGNDPEPFFFFFFFFFRGVGSLSQPRLNIFTVDNMGVMICLGQGGLRSLSVSSCDWFPYYRSKAQYCKSTNFGGYKIWRFSK